LIKHKIKTLFYSALNKNLSNNKFMGKRIFVLIFICISLISNVFGQKIFRDGYVVNIKGDTLGGLVHYFEGSKVPQKIVFKRFDIATPRVYTPLDLVAFGYKNGNHFESQIINGDRILVECFVKGEISLYANGNRIYVEKEGLDLIEISKDNINIESGKNFSSFLDLLRYLTSDVQDIVVPTDLPFDPTSISNLIAEYNKAGNKPYLSYHRKFDEGLLNESLYSTRSRNQSIGFTTGIKRANASYGVNERSFTGFDHKSVSNSISLGAFYNYQISRTTSNLALQIELLFSKNSFMVYQMFEKSFPKETFYLDVLTNQTRISTPVTLVYTYPLGKVQPYANFGFSYNILLKEKGTEYLDVLKSTNDIYTYLVDETSYNRGRDRIRFILGIGAKYRITHNAFVVAGLNTETILSFAGLGLAPSPRITATDSFKFKYVHSPTVELSRKSPIITLRIGFGLDL
jgi:hypothetical protein